MDFKGNDVNLSVDNGFLETHRRPVAVLLAFGAFLTALWWMNATLVYDDIILTLADSSPYGFQFLVNRDGWLATLAHFFYLDLPDQYRTYGLARSLQFLLWSIGVSDAKSYSLIISVTHVATTVMLYFLLVRIKRPIGFALTFAVVWLLSPYIWTSCFHHYSYLTLPTQILIGGLLMLSTIDRKKIRLPVAVTVGVACGLTGEMHILAVPLLFLGLALFLRDKQFFRAAVVVQISMVVAILIHYSLWRAYEADLTLKPRFALSLSHDWPYWSFRINAALKSIYFSFIVPASEMDTTLAKEFWVITIASILCSFGVLLWVHKRNPGRKVDVSSRNGAIFACFLMLVALTYFLIYLAVVILSDSIPHTMPRRYGYIPLTILCAAVVCLLFSVSSRPGWNFLMMSVVMGVAVGLFVFHQAIVLPEVRAFDKRLSLEIAQNLASDRSKGVLFFNASDRNFPRDKIWPDSFGPAMQTNEGTEYTQATYGTYWPAEMEATRLLKAGFSCDITRTAPDNKVEMACPYGAVRKSADAKNVIVVANLGFAEKDPLGKNVRVFSEWSDFVPHFFARKILPSSDSAEIKSKVFFEAPLNGGPNDQHSGRSEASATAAGDQGGGLATMNDSEVLRYGWVQGEKREFSINLKKTDAHFFLDFDDPVGRSLKEALEGISVSWNDGEFVPLGEGSGEVRAGAGGFSIQLSYLDVTQFSISVPSARFNMQPSLRRIKVARFR